MKLEAADGGRLDTELLSFCVQQACLCVCTASLDTAHNVFSVFAHAVMLIVSQQISEYVA